MVYLSEGMVFMWPGKDVDAGMVAKVARHFISNVKIDMSRSALLPASPCHAKELDIPVSPYIGPGTDLYMPYRRYIGPTQAIKDLYIGHI